MEHHFSTFRVDICGTFWWRGFSFRTDWTWGKNKGKQAEIISTASND
jgi:hypothetical protein